MACCCGITNLYGLQEVSGIVNKKSEKKNLGGRPVTTGTGEQINVRLLPEFRAAIDKYQKLVGAQTTPEAIRQATAETLKRKGLL